VPASPKPASVTVVIAARNAAGTITDALRSALASSTVLQCVVVDDASDDATSATAQGLAAEDDRVEVVRRTARGGPARARNDGLARARGGQVCFLDADDVLRSGAIAQLGAALATCRGAVAALGRFHAVDDANEDVDVGSWNANQLRPVLRRKGVMVESPQGMVPEALVTRLVSPPPGAWLVDAGAARALGGFDARARRSEDLELLVRLAASGPVVPVDGVVLEYRRHAAQRSAAQARRRWGRGNTLWLMLRAAPGRDATIELARGMSAYHLDLFAARRRRPELAVRAMGLRNLAAAALLRAAGLAAASMPRRMLAPLELDATGAVD
jgi:glycosyltransferase involved in cell wall biosynthesis